MFIMLTSKNSNKKDLICINDIQKTTNKKDHTQILIRDEGLNYRDVLETPEEIAELLKYTGIVPVISKESIQPYTHLSIQALNKLR